MTSIPLLSRYSGRGTVRVIFPPKSMTCRVTAEIDPRENFYGESALFAGLALLHAHHEIDLRLRAVRSTSELPIPLLHIDSDQDPRTLAFDLYDRADAFSDEALARCDVYFKRSFDRTAIATLSPDHQDKLRPFGLAFGVRAAFSGTKL